MHHIQNFNRRCFLWTGIGFGAPLAFSNRLKSETVYHFASGEWDIRMSVEFHDRYSSTGFWFDELRTNRNYCLSWQGEEGRNCLSKFSGSIAIAHYRIRSRSNSPNLLVLRESVRTIDRDSRVNDRPPFECMLEVRAGLVSDIQAFGYQPDAPSPVKGEPVEPHEPWCLFRQDLYFGGKSAPFLVVHWKHTLSAIRILDVIPGDQTRLIDR